MINVEPRHLEIIKEILSKYVSDAKIYVFGSRAKKSAKPYSDLDIAVDLNDQKLNLSILAKLTSAFEQTTIPYKIDVIDLNSISEEFKNNIKNDLIELTVSQNRAFTLAEVLITLGIIGVVAALTIPIIKNEIDNAQYKSAYKKSYADLSQAFSKTINDKSLIIVWGNTASTTSVWAVIKDAFKVAKECTPANLNECWQDGDKVCSGVCSGGSAGLPAVGTSSSFIDASGRSWAQYTISEPIFLVDTNGFKEPNKFGKDRWMFNLLDSNNAQVTNGFPSKVGLVFNVDFATQNDWCAYPPCNYKSWLYN
jgi:prepilin-type N-terminal cleavage/methylation domain-containing protein